MKSTLRNNFPPSWACVYATWGMLVCNLVSIFKLWSQLNRDHKPGNVDFILVFVLFLHPGDLANTNQSAAARRQRASSAAAAPRQDRMLGTENVDFILVFVVSRTNRLKTVPRTGLS